MERNLPEAQQSFVTTSRYPCPGCLSVLQTFGVQPNLNTTHQSQEDKNGFDIPKLPDVGFGEAQLMQSNLENQHDALANCTPSVTFGQAKQVPPATFIPAFVAWDKKMEEFELFSSAKESNEIVRDLKNIGCCIRCTLRLLGEARPLTYTSSLADLERNLLPEDKWSSVSTKNFPCPGCLDILQTFTEQTFLNQIRKKVTEDGYHFSAYQCSLVLPMCLAVRHIALFLYLHNRYPNVYQGKETCIPSVKKVWKWSCGHRMESLLNAKFQNKGELDILMTFNYADSDTECAFLLDVSPETFKSTKQAKIDFKTFSCSNVTKALLTLEKSTFEECPPPVPTVECNVNVCCSYNSDYIGAVQTQPLLKDPWPGSPPEAFTVKTQPLLKDPWPGSPPEAFTVQTQPLLKDPWPGSPPEAFTVQTPPLLKDPWPGSPPEAFSDGASGSRQNEDDQPPVCGEHQDEETERSAARGAKRGRLGIETFGENGAKRAKMYGKTIQGGRDPPHEITINIFNDATGIRHFNDSRNESLPDEIPAKTTYKYV